MRCLVRDHEYNYHDMLCVVIDSVSDHWKIEELEYTLFCHLSIRKLDLVHVKNQISYIVMNHFFFTKDDLISQSISCRDINEIIVIVWNVNVKMI
jgi:hypothetical protein